MKNKKIVGLGIALCCIFSIGVGVSANASAQENAKVQEIQAYVEQIQEYNLELSAENLQNIPATISLSKNITLEQLQEYVAENDITIVQLQARGIDSNGDMVTFASKVTKGLDETDRILHDLAQNSQIDFVGYNAMYVMTNSDQIIAIQQNDLTYLIETGNIQTDDTTHEQISIEFPQSLSWKLDELGLR